MTEPHLAGSWGAPLDPRLFAAALEHFPDGVGICDEAGRFLVVNRRLCELAGRTEAELLRLRFEDVTHPEDVAVEAPLLAEVRAGVRRTFQREKRCLRPDGTFRWVEVRISLHEHGEGPRRWLLGIVQDVTARHLSEQLLRESEARLREAQRIAGLGSWQLELPSGRLRWSAEIHRICELDPATFEPSYERFLALVHPDDRALLDEVYRRSVEERTAWEFQHRLLLPDGRIKYVVERGLTHYDAHGRALRTTGTVLDVTDRRVAELAAQEREGLLATLFDVTPDALLLLRLDADDQLRIEAINEATLLRAQRYVPGIDEATIRGFELARIGEILPGYRGSALLAMLDVAKAALRAGRTVRHEVSYDSPSGMRDGELTLAPVPATEGKPRQIFWGLRDIGERKRAEQALRASLQEKDTLLREVHHRVKNNLQVVSSLLALQAMHTPEPTVRGPLLESRARVHTMALVHDLLYRTPDVSSIDLGRYVREVAEAVLRGAASEGGPGLRCDCVSIQCDPDTALPYGLIVNELVTNALRHAFPDGRGGTIELRLSRTDGAIELLVADDGVGPPADWSGGEAPAGSLGLRIVRALAGQLGGVLELRARQPGAEIRLRSPGASAVTCPAGSAT